MTQKKTLSDLDYNIDEVIDELQRNLVKGNISIPDDVKRESFADDQNSASLNALSHRHDLVFGILSIISVRSFFVI